MRETMSLPRFPATVRCSPMLLRRELGKSVEQQKLGYSFLRNLQNFETMCVSKHPTAQSLNRFSNKNDKYSNGYQTRLLSFG